ncbi:MAG: acyl-CoA reductase [Bacteroidales bacterium]
MQKDISDVEFLFPIQLDIDNFLNLTPFEPFSENAIEFLNDLSVELNKDVDSRKYGEIAAFAFFCRKANIFSFKKKYLNNQTIRLGRGIVFHIAPSNVAVNFAYSLICGLLSGNLNIVRVPSKEFEQVSVICSAIYRLSLNKKHKFISERLLLVRYDRQSSATAFFSSVCDVRIIWGGDSTIEQIRKSIIPPRSFDVTFADRYSLCVINADVFINETSPEKIALAFYNDTYLFDQNACSSPHLVIWLGSDINVEKSQEIFWTNLYDVVKVKYNIQPVTAVDKLTSFFNQAVKLEKASKVDMPDNSLWRVQLKHLPQNIDDYRCSGGYFSEYHAESLTELSKIINRKYQTLAYYGIEKSELILFVKEVALTGIDRIVPIGRTSDFSLTWDGFDLISTLSRICEIL